MHMMMAGDGLLDNKEKIKLFKQLQNNTAKKGKEAPPEQLKVLKQMFEPPYHKWEPSYATSILALFPKPANSVVGPAPCLK